MLGIVIGGGVIVSCAAMVCLKLASWLSGGTAEAVPTNPLAVAKGLMTGTLAWTRGATVIGVCLCVLIAVAIGGWVVWASKKTPTRLDHAQQYLAGKKDIASMSRDAAQATAKRMFGDSPLARDYPGLRMGKIPGTHTGVWSTWEDLYLIIFGPRMGKTTTQVIPAIFTAPGPVVTTSNKRDIIDDTIAVTRARGNAYAFDPQNIAADFAQDPWYFDPLDSVRRCEETMDSAAMKLADIFLTASRGSEATGDAYFNAAGKDLLSRLFLAAALDNRPISDVFIWASDDTDRTAYRILAGYPQWQQQAVALLGTYNITEKTRSGIFAQAAQMVAPLGRRATLKWVTPQAGWRRFSPDEFVKSAHDTLYVLSKEGADNAAALTTALTAAVMEAAERYGEESGGRLPVPLVAPLDEAANVVRWPELPALYSHYGSRSIILMTILQSYEQGVNVWGKEGMEMLWSAAAVLMYGGGVRDEHMLQKLEALIGDYEERQVSVSRSREGRSTSTQVREKKNLYRRGTHQHGGRTGDCAGRKAQASAH